MTVAAAAFLHALTAEQRDRACYAFGDERRSWSFLPARDRDGLPVGALDEGQRRLGHELIVAGTSLPAYTKVVSIRARRPVLGPSSRECRTDRFNPKRTASSRLGRRGEGTGGGKL